MIGTEKSGVAQAIIARQEELRQDRSNYAQEWDLIASIFRPQRSGFYDGGKNRDRWNLHSLFNSKTLSAQTNATATLYSTLVNPANKWFVVKTPDDDIQTRHDVKMWTELVSRRMLKSFSAAVSPFYSHAVPWMGDSVTFGTGISYDEPDTKRGKIIDLCLSPGDVVIDVDAFGRVNEAILEFRLTAVQAARKYGAENLPKKLRERASNLKDREKTVFYQAIQPNDNYTPGYLGTKGKAILSTHVSVEGEAVVRQGGFEEMPATVSRWDVDGGESWGRGLGYVNAPSGNTLQAMEKSNLQAAAFASRPPIGTTGTKAIKKEARLAPGRFLHGAINHQGQQLMRPILTSQTLPISIDIAKQKIEEVEHGWHAAMLSLVNRTGLGNLEVLGIQEERLRMLSPFLGRMQTEGLTPKLERRFRILWRAGQIPPPPQALAGQPLDMHFTSVAALAQRASEGVAIRRFVNDLTALTQIKPEAADNLDGDYLARALQETGGVPPGALLPKEAVDQSRQQRQQIEQAQMAMEAATAAGGAARDFAQAEAAGTA